MNEFSSSKLNYLHNSTMLDRLQDIYLHLPRPWIRKKIFVLWTSTGNSLSPITIDFTFKKLKLRKTMRGDLMTLYKINSLFNQVQKLLGTDSYGFAINLRSFAGYVVIDLDDIDPALLCTPVTQDSCIQHKIFNSLLQAPCYREISLSRRGCHLIFFNKDFFSLIGNRWALRPAPGVELYLGGYKNKLISLTGWVDNLSSDGLEIEGELFRTPRKKWSQFIIPSSESQLTSFLLILKELEDSSIKNESYIESSSFPSYDSFKRSFVRKETTLPDPENKRGYSPISSVINLHKDILASGNFSSSRFKSYSEFDFWIFLNIIKLYPTRRVSGVNELINCCLDFYNRVLPPRNNKSFDYFIRTCYAAYCSITNKLAAKTLTSDNSSNLSTDLSTDLSTGSYLINTPRGMLSSIYPSKTNNLIVTLEQSQVLKNFDFDLYQILLEQAVRENLAFSGDNTSIARIKCTLYTTIGSLARALTQRKNPSVIYYEKIVHTLKRLSSARISWKNPSGEGSVALLEFIVHHGRLEVVFTNIIAYCLTQSRPKLKDLPIQYVCHYTQIMSRYKTPYQRQLYRYLINNVSIQACKTIKIDNLFLASFYDGYTTRRHSFYRNLFIKLLNEFILIRDTDMRVEVLDNNTFIFHRLNVD